MTGKTNGELTKDGGLPDAAIYTGVVRHRRLRPCQHLFERRLLMLWQRADSVNADGGGRGFLPCLRRRDLLRPQVPSLSNAARAAAKEITGANGGGAVYVLAQPRQFGVSYNPASFYIICKESGEPETLLVEVDNTPWRQRFCYAAPFGNGGESTMQKRGHVSPFNPMTMRYQWRFTFPGARFAVAMKCIAEDGKADMEVLMLLRRRQYTRRNLITAAMAHPFSAAANAAAIYTNALRLLLKGAPSYPHPDDARPRFFRGDC